MDLKIELQLLVKKCIGDEENYMINRMVAAICLQNKKDKQLILSGVVKSDSEQFTPNDVKLPKENKPISMHTDSKKPLNKKV